MKIKDISNEEITKALIEKKQKESTGKLGDDDPLTVRRKPNPDNPPVKCSYCGSCNIELILTPFSFSSPDIDCLDCGKCEGFYSYMGKNVIQVLVEEGIIQEED